MKMSLCRSFFILVVAIFLAPIIVLAAPADPDRFPQYTPLLPPPQNSQVDYEHPLNSPPPPDIIRPEPGQESGTSRPDVTVGSGEQASQPAAAPSAAVGKERAGSYGKAILIVSLGVLLGYGIWRIRYSKKE